MPSLSELMAQQAALERQINAARIAARNEALAQIRILMSEHGLTARDLVAAPPSKTGRGDSAGSKVAPKYRDPETGATWTGRGLKPKWLAERLAQGRQIMEFAI